MADTIRFGNLTIDIQQTPTEVTYKFTGDVDEHFRQKDVPRIKAGLITLVLEGINNFNSCGIREWIYLLRDMSELGRIRFTRCSVTMVDQVNMVPDSLGSGSVESFFAPYFCTDHGEVSRLIVVKDAERDLAERKAPEMHCETCKKTLEFDALEESYFLFAHNGAALNKAG